MGGSKAWYESKTIWGAVMVFVAQGLKMAGLEFGQGEQDLTVQAIVTGLSVVGALLSVYGRVKATREIG